MSDADRTKAERAERWERRTKAAIGIAGGLVMLGVAITRNDLTAGVVGYGFAAMALVEVENNATFKTIALSAATLYILYMIVTSHINAPGEFDFWMGLPPLLAPLAAHWGGMAVRRWKSAR